MDKVTKWKIIGCVAAALIISAAAFFAGRATINTKTITVVKYIKGETVENTIYKPEPYEVVRPIDTLKILQQCIDDGVYAELWPSKVDTAYVFTQADTTAILKDWSEKRLYSKQMFDSDSLGTLAVNAEVQYNRLSSLGYKFTPAVKEVNTTVYKVKAISPFFGAGVMANPFVKEEEKPIEVMAGADAGLFIKEKYGIMLKYQRSFQTNANYVGGSFLIKF